MYAFKHARIYINHICISWINKCFENEGCFGRQDLNKLNTNIVINLSISNGEINLWFCVPRMACLPCIDVCNEIIWYEAGLCLRSTHIHCIIPYAKHVIWGMIGHSMRSNKEEFILNTCIQIDNYEAGLIWSCMASNTSPWVKLIHPLQNSIVILKIQMQMHNTAACLPWNFKN